MPAKVDDFVVFDGKFMPDLMKAGAIKDQQAIRVGTINPYRYAQMLTKIAYAYAVAENGYGSFKPLVRPILKGEAETWADLVGGDYEVPEAEPHLFSLQCYAVLGAKGRFLCVKMRLWSFVGSPVYRVVVGTM